MGFRGSKRHFATKGVICWLRQLFLNWGFAYLDSISRDGSLRFAGVAGYVSLGTRILPGEGELRDFTTLGRIILPRAIWASSKGR